MWQRYVAVACSQAWQLDLAATEELLRCIETLASAAPINGSATVKLYLGTWVGELTMVESGERVRIGVRSRLRAIAGVPREWDR